MSIRTAESFFARRLAIVILLFAAVPLFGYRREYLVMLEGARKAGGEVCFYRGDTNTALSLFFSADKKGCLPADKVIDLPPGTFNFFARHQDGYVSVLRDYTIYDGPPIPERGYQRIEIPVVRAGIVDATVPAKSLQAGQSLGLWIAPTANSPGSFIPLIAGETTILAPAGMPLLPMLIEGGAPVAIGDAVSVDEGSRIVLPAFARGKQTTDVVAWLQLDKESFRAARGIMLPPDVTLVAAGKTLKPQFSLFEPASKTLVIFRDVPPGPAELRLTGMMWKPVKRAIDVAGSVTVAREGLPMVAAGSVRVQWTNDGIESTPPATCAGVSAADAPRVAVAILKCGTEQHCEPVTTTSVLFQGNSAVSLDGVPAGSYIAAVRAPLTREQRFPVDVIAGQQQTISATITPFQFFGTVTLNGAPVRAHVVFASGEAVSDDTGRYTASLAAPPLGNNVRVELCGTDRWFDHYPDDSIKANSPHDIDLRVRSLTVHVADPRNRSLKDAAVSLCIVKRFGPDGITPLSCRHNYPAGISDERGDLVVDIPADFPVQVCATHKSFSRQCGLAIQPNALTDGRTLVRFEPAGLRGRVEHHSGEGMLTFVAPTGQTTEDVPIDPDGTFVTRMPHAPPEHFVYASSNRPLTVLPMPVLSSDEFIVTLPPAPVRRFTVTVPDMTAKTGFVGVWIGGLYVPLLTMDFHETSRGVDSILYRGQSLEFRDISETGPIAVAFGTPPDAAAAQFVDIFTLPQFAGVERHEVTGPALKLRR